MTDPCMQCGGRCCDTNRLAIGYRWRRHGESLTQLLGRIPMVDVIRKDGTFPRMIWIWTPEALAFKCLELEGGRCKNYEQRPLLCSHFKCPFLKGEMTYEEMLWFAGPRPTTMPALNVTRQVERHLQRISRVQHHQSD